MERRFITRCAFSNRNIYLKTPRSHPEKASLLLAKNETLREVLDKNDVLYTAVDEKPGFPDKKRSLTKPSGCDGGGT